MNKNERTLKMEKDYIELHNKGMSVAEIAEVYGLSTWTIYQSLGKIATEAGVSRESLLRRPRAEKGLRCARKFEPVEPIDLETLKQTFQQTMVDLTHAQHEIERTIEAQEQIADEFDEDFDEEGK